jgi:hypothetical protein
MGPSSKGLQAMSDQSVTVSYAISPAARKIFAKVTGSLDPTAMPNVPNIPSVVFVPQKGDDVRWEAIGYEHAFYVTDRSVRFTADGNIEIVLCVDVPPA